MNATSLYVSTSRLVLQSDGNSDQNWTDLYRLVPYLRQSLSCTVCGCLLIEPYSPTDIHCQHHVCRLCLGGRKNLKPTCSWCKDYDKYEKNMQLRILLQCYKSLCEYIIAAPIYNWVRKQSQAAGLLSNGLVNPNTSLVELIDEGAKFQDNFKSNAGLSRSAYSILPCVFPNPAAPPTNKAPCAPKPQNANVIATIPVGSQIPQINQPPPIKTVSNGSAMYSVLYSGIGNKITIKRKRKSDGEDDFNTRKFQTVIRPKSVMKRKGCRCGNATPTPGKLTCCGQRCPCYVDSKSCIDCKCRGCRNPHRPDGGKIRPHIPELACYEIQMADDSTNLSSASLATTPNNCIDDFNISPLNTIKSQPGISFSNHQIRQPLSLGNVGLISSQEGGIQVVNVFTSSHQGATLPHHHHVQLTTDHSSNSRSHHHQIPEISTTLPQILMQQQDVGQLQSQQHTAQFLTTHTAGLGSSHHSSISMPATMSSLSSNSVSLSPIIVTPSSTFSSQIFTEDEIITTQCSTSPLQPPPLIDLIVSNVSNSNGNINV